jgi:hypothetical protein
MKKPQAILLSATPNPLETMWNGWFWTRDPSKVIQGTTIQDVPAHYVPGVPLRPKTTSLTNFTSELVQHALNMLKEHVPIPEMVQFMFGLSSIPRSFQEQIVRTRKAAFFCETHRVVDKSSFADEEDYFPPDGEPTSNIDYEYKRAMFNAQEAYRCLRAMNVPPELARGVLPMHVNSRLVMGIDLRTFTGMMRQRTCWIAQGSYWQPLIESIRPQMEGYIGKEVSDYIFQPPCEVDGTCIMETEAQARQRGESPYEPCPKYIWPVEKDGKEG